MTRLTETTKEALKSADPDRVRAALMATAEVRDDLIVLYAFHHELAKVPEVTSEPMLGQIRYQWWRDAVEEIYGDAPVRRHEVSTPLADLLSRHDIPRFLIDKLIDGRERDLDPQPFADLAAAQDYAAATSGVLAGLAARICGAESDVASQLGTVWGLCGLVRAWRFYHDRMLSNLDREVLIQACESEYAAARQTIPTDMMPAIAYAALIPGYLKRAKLADDPLQVAPVYSPFRKQTRLMMTGLSGKLP